MIALMMFDEYIKHQDLNGARKWGEILINDTNRPDTGEKEFISAKLFFESGQFESAHEKFKIAFKKSDGLEFDGKDPKYLDFYLNPVKYE